MKALKKLEELFFILLMLFSNAIISQEKNYEFLFLFGSFPDAKVGINFRETYKVDSYVDGASYLGFSLSKYFKDYFGMEFSILRNLDIFPNAIDSGSEKYTHLDLCLFLQYSKRPFSPSLSAGIGFSDIYESGGYCGYEKCYKFKNEGISFKISGGLKIYFTKNFLLKLEYKNFLIKINEKDDCYEYLGCLFYDDYFKTSSYSFGLGFTF